MKNISTDHKNLSLLILIVLTAAVLRLLHLGGFSYSNDELSALYRVQFDRFSDLVSGGFYVDGHPGGVQVFLYYWVKAFGMSEFAVRLPFALAGILSVFMVYKVGKRWFSDASGICAALFLAVLEFPLLYSQVARPYVTGLLFVLMTTWFWTRLVFDNESMSKRTLWLHAAGYTLSMSLCMYNHYFSFLMATITGLTGLFLIRRSNMVPYLVAGAAAILLFVPHIPITLNHLRIGGVGLWLGKPSWDFIFRHIFYIFNESWFLLIAVAAAVGWTLWKQRRTIAFGRFRLLALIWFLLPMIVGFVYSSAVNPVLQDSVLIFSFPFLILLLFSWAMPFSGRTGLALLALLFAAGLFSLLAEKKYYHSQHFGEFRDIARHVAEWDRTYGESNIGRAINVNNPWYIDFYLKKMGSGASFLQYENKGGMDLLDLKHVAEQCRTPYFLYAWTKPTLPETEDIVRTYYPYIVEKHEYADLSAIGLYSKDPPGNGFSGPGPLLVVKNGFETAGRWQADPLRMDTSFFYSGSAGYRFDSALEFGPAFDTLFGQISSQPVRTIKVSLWGMAPPGLMKTPIVISVDDASGKNYLWASRDMDNFLDEYTWGKVHFTYKLPHAPSPGDRLKIYVWNPKRCEFTIDEMEIRFYD
jgi:4-amino-4-deoxy-L-arabinose transferase-like glycosyltransferase